jgi:hypothetical protein
VSVKDTPTNTSTPRTTSSPCRPSTRRPALEKLTWRCAYIGGVAGLGFSALDAVNVDTCIINDDLTRATTLCFRYPSIFTRKYYCKDLDFLNEIEKHMVTDLSVLKLYLGTRGHVFGPFVVHLLGMQRRGMHPICTPTRSLNIFLRASKVPKSRAGRSVRPNRSVRFLGI